MIIIEDITHDLRNKIIAGRMIERAKVKNERQDKLEAKLSAKKIKKWEFTELYTQHYHINERDVNEYWWKTYRKKIA